MTFVVAAHMCVHDTEHGAHAKMTTLTECYNVKFERASTHECAQMISIRILTHLALRCCVFLGRLFHLDLIDLDPLVLNK